jgi:hypothetical protein
MGEVIHFPGDAAHTRGGKYVDANTEPATVIILPVIRIERGSGDSGDSAPYPGSPATRRRRRRLTR